MTANKITRDITDARWSGRLVEGAEGGWGDEDCTFEHLASHLKAAGKLVEKLAPDEYYASSGHGWVESENAAKMAKLFELLDSLQRYLPWVEAWCVGEERGVAETYDVTGRVFCTTPAHFLAISAHEDRCDATQWATYIQPLYPKHPLCVRQAKVPVLMVRHADAEPERFVCFDEMGMGPGEPLYGVEVPT